MEVKFSMGYDTDLPVKADSWFSPPSPTHTLDYVLTCLSGANDCSTEPQSVDIGYQPSAYEYWYSPTGWSQQIDLATLPPDKMATGIGWEVVQPGKACDEATPSITLVFITDSKFFEHPTYNWKKGTDYFCGLAPYTHLCLQDNKLIFPTLSSDCTDRGDGTYLCQDSTTRSMFPKAVLKLPIITPGNAEALKTASLANYTPMGEQDWFDTNTAINWETLCGFDPNTYGWLGPYDWFGSGTIKHQYIHWLSDTDQIQEGFFALNLKNTCNGRVNFVSDNASYFNSGTYILSVEDWVASSTTDDDTYLGLRDTVPAFLTITALGVVQNSKVLSTSVDEENHFEIDNDKLNLLYSKVNGDASKKLSVPVANEKVCQYTEVEGVVTVTQLVDKVNSTCKGNLTKSCLTCQDNLETYNLNMKNSSLIVTNPTVVDELIVSGSDTILDVSDVNLTLVNYVANNLTIAASNNLGKIEFYLGTTVLFDLFDLNILFNVDAEAVNYKVSMVDCVFTTQPSKITFEGLSLADYDVKGGSSTYIALATKYLISGVDFDSAGADPKQAWTDTEVIYTLSLGDFPKKNLGAYGIPTGTILSTRQNIAGVYGLERRVTKKTIYDKLFSAENSLLAEIENESPDARYNPNDVTVDDIELPRCDK